MASSRIESLSSKAATTNIDDTISPVWTMCARMLLRSSADFTSRSQALGRSMHASMQRSFVEQTPVASNSHESPTHNNGHQSLSASNAHNVIW